MDTYEIGRSLAAHSYQSWINKEVFTFDWFVMLGVLIVVYSVWLKLVDKSRLKDLLLFGSLISIGFIFSDVILGKYIGLYSYKVALVPFEPSFLIASVTIAPIMFMLVMQYTSSWRGFILWAAIACAVYSFVLIPIYKNLGIVQFYKGYNFFFSFLRTLIGGVVGRAFFMWFSGIEQRHSAANRVSQQFAAKEATVPQPAMKPLENDGNIEN